MIWIVIATVLAAVSGDWGLFSILVGGGAVLGGTICGIRALARMFAGFTKAA